MKKSEKILAGAVLGIIALFLIGFGVKGAFLRPLKSIDKQTALLRDKINKINQERREYFDAEDHLKRIAQHTFSAELNQASARSGEMITRELAQAGLNEADFTRLPVGPRRLRDVSEIGWSIQGKGDLNRMINLIFLLQNTPQIHRIEDLTLSSYEKPGEIKVRFLYLTLVLQPAPDFEPIELKPKYTLQSPERLAYNTILERDILRPYIKMPPPPANPSSAPSSRPPGPESLRVVSLSEWDGQPEVHIRDLANNKTLHFRPGDTMKDGTEIAAIDYRSMPLPRDPLLKSDSRLILKIGSDYWAVERGQTLAEKRKLQASEWPLR